MKLSIEKRDGTFFLRLEYRKGEWEKIEDAYRRMGLELYETQRLFGFRNAMVYRYTGACPAPEPIYMDGMEVIDDINQPFLRWSGHLYINLAVFRIVPTGGVVEEEVREELIPKEFLKDVGKVFKKYFERLLSQKVRVKYTYELSLDGGEQQ